jgi:hypothetical protein
MSKWRSSQLRRPSKASSARKARLGVELLEQRNLLTPTNVLVNNVNEDTTVHDVQSETSIALAGSNVVVAFNDSEEFTGSNNHFTGWSVSTDSGTSFSDKDALPASTVGDAGDPSLAFSSSAGALFFSTLGFSSSNVIQVFKSTDNGQTFGPPVAGATGGSFDQLDKEWMTVDNFSGRGGGNIYLTYTDFGLFSTSIKLSRSTNGGSSFRAGPTLASGTVQGTNVVVGTDHSVYVFWLDGNAASERILMKKSTSQGRSFGSAVTVATLATTGVNGDLGFDFRSNAFPQAAVNPANGNIYVVFDDKGQASGDRGDAYFTESTNGGSSWSAPIKLNDDATAADQWFPAIAVTPDGSHVFVTWYDRRLSGPGNGLIDRFGVIGTVSGSTVMFGANGRITDTSFPEVFGGDPNVVFNYMGDYDTATADNNFFYTSWGDNRLPDAAHTNNPDVRFAKVAVTGIVGPAGTFIVPPSTGRTLAGAKPTALAALETALGTSPGLTGEVVVVGALVGTPVKPPITPPTVVITPPSHNQPAPLDTGRVDQGFIASKPQDALLAAPTQHAPSPDSSWLPNTNLDGLWQLS